VTGRPLIRNRDTALYIGLACWIAGGVLLWDAWEHRGIQRPWAMRLAGLVPV